MGRVAIYDNHKHKGRWYYWLNPGDRFNFGHPPAARTNNRRSIAIDTL